MTISLSTIFDMDKIDIGTASHRPRTQPKSLLQQTCKRLIYSDEVVGGLKLMPSIIYLTRYNMDVGCEVISQFNWKLVDFNRIGQNPI